MKSDLTRSIGLPIPPRLALAMLALSVLLLSTAPVQRAAAAPGDTVADRVFGQPDFTSRTCNNGGVTASTLCTPGGPAVDSAGNLYVADAVTAGFNNRVLEYNTPLTADTAADRVFGQAGSFTTNTCNKGGISASSLCDPAAVAVDAARNLYVSDQSNNRVLEYDTPLTTDTVGDRVFGQPNFTSSTPNNGGVSASSMDAPSGVAVDGGGHLFVADLYNNRVLEYDSPLTTDRVADRVFGQGSSFTTGDCNKGGAITASSICTPAGVAVDGSGNLFVADELNNRVLEYDTPLTTDTVADRVFGQAGSFTTGDCNNGGAISASSLCYPWGVAVDGAGNLYVADVGNSRVLEYDSPLTTDTVADRVFGQAGSFTTGDCNKGGVVSASTLCEGGWVSADIAGNLYVSDRANSRVVEYDAPVASPAVGGIAELPSLAGASPEEAGAPGNQSGWSAGGYGALAGGLAAGAVAIAAGGWYLRRRWLR